MNAPVAQAAAEAAFAPGCVLLLFWVLEIVKRILKLGFRLGLDLVILSIYQWCQHIGEQWRSV
jgi:hypothetical protein